MPDIFKAKIAQKINSALGPLVFPATLIKEVPGVRSNKNTAGTNPVVTSYAAKGFVDSYKAYLIDGTLIKVGDKKVTLLGASLTVVPAPGDRVTIEGVTRQIVTVYRDPAGATYECQAR